MNIELNDKVAFITGGSRGIGEAIVKTFAKSQATTIFTYAHSQQKANEIVERLRSEGHKVHAYQADVADTKAMGTLIEEVHGEFGRIDILVNNAGIIRDTLIMMMNEHDWLDVINTNLTGAYNTIKPISKIMMRQRSGCIINMSSIAASKPGRGHANYAASKGAIESMTKALAQELGAKNIRVNAIAPGMIETDMSQEVRNAASDLLLKSIALRRFGKPEEIAHVALFLASDLASYITGEIIHVDGGL